jgi:gas vesicle protein
MKRSSVVLAALMMSSAAFVSNRAAEADVLKKVGKAVKKAAKDVKETAKDVGKAVVETAKDAVEAVSDAVAGLAKIIKKKIQELANTSPAEIVELFNDGYKKLPKAIRVLFDKVLQGLVTMLAPIFVEARGAWVEALKAIADPLVKALGRRSARRTRSAQCDNVLSDVGKSISKTTASVASSIANFAEKIAKATKDWFLDQLPNMAKLLGKGVATAFKLGMLELLTKRISAIWGQMKGAADWEKTVTLEEYKANPGVEPKSLAERMSGLKSGTDVAKMSGIAILATIATKLVEYPSAYLVGAASCVRDNKASVSRSDYKSCYVSAFQKYSKDWFFSLLIGSAVAPLTPTVIGPVTTYLGTVAAGFAANVLNAVTAGAGVAVAPLVGMATMAVLNFLASHFISYGFEKAFFDLYEKTSWKGTCPFFKSLVSADVINSFGKRATGDSSSEATYRCP